jgi:anti-sigma B factor antagonist
MDLSISIGAPGGPSTWTVLTLDGEIDVASSDMLRAALLDLHRRGRRWLVLDLSQVHYCDSTGIGVLAIHAKRLLDSGGALRLVGLRPVVAEIFEIAGLTAVIPACDTVREALEARSGVSAGPGPYTYPP